ncbi:MAG: sigma-54-dependent Fis family transcriptional regulator [Gammaproteobacteria bacterium]|nr:sigma-54-dependent Fis family transcriptional regulator [Gammaproteobacteria bacterium]MCG3144206.1 Regulatory protein AtoC [Gammaproteobacteria bacterium]
MSARILVVEDDNALREALSMTLELAGHEVFGAADGHGALAALGERQFDLIVTDVQMRPMDGHTLLTHVKARDASLPVLLMTAYGTIPSAVQAMRDGASDYLVKPFDAEVLAAKVSELLSASTTATTDGGMVAVDPVMKDVVKLARRVAQSDATVLLTGESGVGKEVMFRYLHENSPRSRGPAVALNCAAIPENMLEAILFGYEKGAFTGAYKPSPGKFEQAQGGSILLDEISEMSLPLQAKLLRVLQERQVERLGSNKVTDLDVRVIATTNRDLRAEVDAGRFREDLFYRLNVFPIRVPALREHREDVVPLAEFLLARAAARTSVGCPALSPEACELLQSYGWPGNVRELDNVMQRALIVHDGRQVEAHDIRFEQRGAIVPMPAIARTEEPAGGAGDDPDGENDSLAGDLRDRERRIIMDALQESRGSRKTAAARLGISERTLRYKLARMREDGLSVPLR